MPKVLVGRDASVFIVRGGGLDTAISNFNPGPEINFWGVWKDIEVTFTNNWVDTTPSSGEEEESRRTTYKWRANLSNLVRLGGSPALDLILNHDYIQVQYTESVSGKTVTLIGGMDEASYKRSQEAANETLNLRNVGPYNNGPSIFYQL